VLTVSEATKRDLVEFVGLSPERVTVTPLAADPAVFFPGDRVAAASHVAARFGVTGPFVLYIARIEHPGKNHARLIRAFDRLKTRTGLPHKLVLAGSDRERASEVHAEAASARHARDIVFTGFVPSDSVADLYRAADVFAFPSLFEGFGLPLLEAMACGTPVVAADVASLPEVAGDAARLIDPRDEQALAAALEAVLTDPVLHADLVARGRLRSEAFSWQRTARQTLDVFLRFVDSGPRIR
jgi:glycosyltransferase involved in cell wall biosynthesis